MTKGKNPNDKKATLRIIGGKSDTQWKGGKAIWEVINSRKYK